MWKLLVILVVKVLSIDKTTKKLIIHLLLGFDDRRFVETVKRYVDHTTEINITQISAH